MKVAVTGNLGYIGPVVTTILEALGHQVVGIDLGWYLGDYADTPVIPRLQFRQDIRRGIRLKGLDAIVHLAGLSNDPIGNLDPTFTREINYEGTVSALMPGIRNLVISSCSVYGANDRVVTEADPTNPLTVYAECKRDVDTWLTTFGESIGITDWASLRLGTVYGWSPGHRIDLVVNRMVWDALNKGYLTVTGNAARPLVHVLDVAAAVLHFLEPNGPQGIYNIVGENLRMEELGTLISDELGVPMRTSDGAGDQRDYMASGDKAARVGFRPVWSVEESLYALARDTASLPLGRRYERLPIARQYLGIKENSK